MPCATDATDPANTTYAANTPQLYLDIDREKVQTLGIEVSAVFSALQAVLAALSGATRP